MILNHDNFEYIKIPFKFSKKYSILLFTSGIIYGFVYNCAIFVLSIVLDRLGSSRFSLSNLIRPLSIYLICMGLMFLINILQTNYQNNFKYHAFIESNKSLYTKKYRMNYILNEDSIILDKFNMLKNFDENIVNYVKSLVFFVTLFFQLLFLFFLISVYSIPTASLICLFTIIILFQVSKGGNATYEAHKKVQPLEREKNVIKEILVDFSYVEERNLFKYGDYLCTRYNNKANESRKYKNKSLSIWFFKAQFGGITFIIFTIIISFILGLALLRGEISLGLFVSLFSTFIQLSDIMSWDLSDNVDHFIESSSKNRDYIEFLNLDESEYKDSISPSITKEIDSIEFKNVSFRYLNSENTILTNINFILECGKKYAIVGENGCGKTTIFKLLLGLYQNYEGKILFFDKNSNSLNINIFRNDLCVVFQDFSNYFISIKDFLQLGTSHTLLEEEIYEIFDKFNIDLKISFLSNGLDTPLGNILEEGTNISGGQWQKLCLARAVLSKKNLLILDEPTSAIDPISELKIMETFKALCSNKTIIYITHRLATIKDCDNIFVIDAGNVVENGNHKNLMCVNGLYRKMFDTQKSWYKNELGGDLLEAEN
ncbi:ATP-binding cassette subfamily B protein [Lachnotalea glycerini]|uniref:ATP-binding cassette subfamily B protein n=1 Tax=Lachnotalea glycerini TaxID=1763509 RepID=A0A318ENH3_9FIRM|nr:ABC transporter ATP-binding protein [Lachnotalea glycerini]PXV86289.1 ATP-binding cassette subfamily B protein [Lachnotalea glycerini]